MTIDKKLPLGVTSLSKMMDENYIYVDKTDIIAEIANGSGPYFLSRPRRFGKSTLVNTMHELFANGLGKFQGLKIEQDGLYKDDKTYTVLHLDFSGKNQDGVDIGMLLLFSLSTTTLILMSKNLTFVLCGRSFF